MVRGAWKIQHFVKNTKTRGYKSYIVCIFGEHVRHIQGKENMKLEWHYNRTIVR